MTDENPKYEIGVIHGRFQILHNDHLRYLLAGKALCDHLIVGITNPDPYLTKDHDSNPHRSTRLANPLTYYERYVMITAVLTEVGLGLSEFTVVPFPINVPDLLQYYVPLDAVFFLSIYDDWGRQKKTYLEDLGLNVYVLWEVPIDKKGLNGSNIRRAMIDNKQWKQFVPSCVAKLVEKWDIINRLKVLSKS